MSEVGHKEKEVAYYTAIVDAWVGTSMERDRSILYITSGAIGLLITLATTSHEFTRWEFVFYFVSLASFLIAIVFILIVFHRNTAYLILLKKEAEGDGDEAAKKAEERRLYFLDKSVLILFGLGVLFAFGIAVQNLSKHPILKEECMEEKKGYSLNGLDKMSPKGDERSLSGLDALRPKPVQPPAETPPPPVDKPAVAPKKD